MSPIYGLSRALSFGVMVAMLTAAGGSHGHPKICGLNGGMPSPHHYSGHVHWGCTSVDEHNGPLDGGEVMGPYAGFCVGWEALQLPHGPVTWGQGSRASKMLPHMGVYGGVHLRQHVCHHVHGHIEGALAWVP